MARIKLYDAVFLHVFCGAGAGVDESLEGACKQQQIGGAESISAEAVVMFLVEEGGGAGSVARSVEDFYLTTSQINDLTVLQVVDLSLVGIAAGGDHGLIGRIDPDFREAADAAHMVSVAMGKGHHDGLVR